MVMFGFMAVLVLGLLGAIMYGVSWDSITVVLLLLFCVLLWSGRERKGGDQ